MGASVEAEPGISRNTGMWSEFNEVTAQGSLVRVRFLVMKISRISGCLSGSPGKCVHSAGASTEKLFRSKSFIRDMPFEFL